MRQSGHIVAENALVPHIDPCLVSQGKPRAIESLVSSPWLYAALIAVSFLDSFPPLIPSEPVVIVSGVHAATGQTGIVLVIAATTLGAFLGDLVPYTTGRLFGARLLQRLPPGTKRRAAHDRARRRGARRPR